MRMFLSMMALLLLLPGPGGAAEPLPKEVTVNGVEFVLIPEGWFWYSVFALDISEHNDNRTRYRYAKVWLDDFYLAKYEARARDQLRFMNAGAASPEALAGIVDTLKRAGVENPKHSDRDCTVLGRPDGSYVLAEPDRDLPATNLSWTLANEFARWMGFRLPTEAEWEKAARGPDKRLWTWGDQYPDDTVAAAGWARQCSPVPVDSYPKGRSPYGIHHMAGNASEYVADWYNQTFDNGISDGMRNPALATEGSPVPYEALSKISKGGDWSMDASYSAVPVRNLISPHTTTSRMGVRFALDASAVRKHIENGTAVVTKQ